MIHGPCGFLNRECICMKEGKCSKSFPKELCDETQVNVNGYPRYRRRQDGRTVDVRGCHLDNRWVVPYNAFLLLKYGAHVNVEICTSIKSVKYLYKYVHKGADCANIEITQTLQNGVMHWDEVTTYLDTRYICPPEGMWRLLEEKLHDQSHSIYRLAVHLPSQQSVVFRAGRAEEAVARAADRDTTLTAWFKLNAVDEEARPLLYGEIADTFVFNQKNLTWIKRINKAATISRMFTVSPKDAERFYLRLLLLHVRGATCFEDIRTFDGIIYPTFKEPARARDLLSNDEMWVKCLKERVIHEMPSQLRFTFTTICVFCEIHNALELWEQFKDDLSEDYARTRDRELSYNCALLDIENNLRDNSVTMQSLGLPIPQPDASVVLDCETYHTETEKQLGEDRYAQLNCDQLNAADAILRAVETPVQGNNMFYVDGPGGTGKTLLFETLLHIIRGRGAQAIAVAWTGIAATLLTGGRTAHSTFKLPVPLLDNSTSSMRPSSREAQQLRDCILFLFDEASMIPAYGLHAIDLLLRDIMGEPTMPFGGKVVVFGGDFRQVLPVLPHASRAAVVGSSIKRSRLRPWFKVLSLTTNMRAGLSEKAFASWLLLMENGDLPVCDDVSQNAVMIPTECVTRDVVSQVFGFSIDTTNPSGYIHHAILCPKNDECRELNEKVLKLILGQSTDYYSIDTIESDNFDKAAAYPTEFLNSVTPSGMPPHKLSLKCGAVVMLIRNLNSKKGLCNGTRMIVRSLHKYIIEAEPITGKSKGQRICIPRIDLKPSESGLPFVMSRRQFPIKLAFAMTINKAQGQTLNKLGIYLLDPVFSHGQLYVAFSRVRKMSDVKIQVVQTHQQGYFINKGGTFTSNVVYKEIL